MHVFARRYCLHSLLPQKDTQKHWILSTVEDIYINCLKLNVTYLTTPFLTDLFFSPLGKPADRAIYFTFRNFLETNYLKICWTDFHNLYVKWKLFGRRWSTRTSFFDISRDVAMATDFVQKWGLITYPPALIALSLQSEMGYHLADECINSSTNCSTSWKKWWKSVQ